MYITEKIISFRYLIAFLILLVFFGCGKDYKIDDDVDNIKRYVEGFVRIMFAKALSPGVFNDYFATKHDTEKAMSIIKNIVEKYNVFAIKKLEKISFKSILKIDQTHYFCRVFVSFIYNDKEVDYANLMFIVTKSNGKLFLSI